MSEQPAYIVNPEAVGDPDQTPIVQLPPSLAAFFERTRCPECRAINQRHVEGCPTMWEPSACTLEDGHAGMCAP